MGIVMSMGRPFGSTLYYEVLLVGEEDAELFPRDDLELVESDRSNPASWLITQPLLDAEEFSEVFTVLRLTTRLSDVLYSFLSSRTVFRVYQFKPVLGVVGVERLPGRRHEGPPGGSGPSSRYRQG
jgi:hypothetical protein